MRKDNIESGMRKIQTLRNQKSDDRAGLYNHLQLLGNALQLTSSHARMKMIENMVQLVAALKHPEMNGPESDDPESTEKLSMSKSFYLRLNDRQLLQKALFVELLARNNMHKLRTLGINVSQIHALKEKINLLQYQAVI
ncbi:MAG: hypothetical protein ACM3SM_12720 [Bacteroidota bacterium]